MVSIGVVCEGSHDFYFLAEVADELLKSKGHSGNSFESLQPRVDATSMQIDGGGYEAVHQWLIANRQIGLKKFFEPALFATSKVYDAIIVQLDGDVADISADFKTSVYSDAFSNVGDRVRAIKSWICESIQAEPAYALSIISAVPTLQMEAWIVAGLRPFAIHVENKPRKGATKRFLRARFQGNAVEQVRAAGKEARAHIPSMRSRAASFDSFCSDLEKRF